MKALKELRLPACSPGPDWHAECNDPSQGTSSRARSPGPAQHTFTARPPDLSTKAGGNRHRPPLFAAALKPGVAIVPFVEAPWPSTKDRRTVPDHRAVVTSKTWGEQRWSTDNWGAQG